VAAENGTEAISKWHDPAGVIILSICFFVLWGLTHFVSGRPPRLEISKGIVPRPFPRAAANGLGGWLFVAILGTEIWYRAHESGEKLKWSIEFPSTKEHFADVEIPDLLGDERRAASWTESDGSRWTAFFFKWDAGPPSSRILARLHRPENSLPAAGYELRKEKNIMVRARDLSLPFRAMDFDYHGQAQVQSAWRRYAIVARERVNRSPMAVHKSGIQFI
jgi:hypothetical protein